ncbi:MAG: polyprenyl synthetase family protein [Clostridia bacterium]|nr:polyprenyl synthetase family protein [Clostridia bacterium]
MDVKEYLKAKKEIVEKALDLYLPGEDAEPKIIHEAMRYSVFAGGKRIRPILVIASAEAVGGNEETVLPAACALEMIHTYSLIHDDLPAMDNDDYRRGKPTNHKVFGEAMAILAGDALLTHAFGVITRCSGKVDDSSIMMVLRELSEAAGSMGMVGGQVMDILSEGKEINGEELQFIHRHKTGCLFRASIRTGAILSGANHEKLAALTAYAEHLGLAFQIIDDILDVTGNEKKLGKKTGSDIKKQKATYPALYGLEKSRELAKKEIESAVESLKGLGAAADPLRGIALYLGKRDS